MAYVIVLAFVVSGFATVVTLPRNDMSEDVADARISTIPAAQAHWDMSTLRNGKVQNLADSSGATDGTMLNTVPSANGIVGGSLDFNGNSAAVDCPDPNNLLKSDSGTVSAWIKSTGKPPETTKLRVAIVILENNGSVATEEDKDALRLVGENATRIYSEMVHGHGSLEVSPTIYVQTPVDLNITYPHLLELNNFIRLGNPDIYDFICFFTKKYQSNWYFPGNMMNFKNSMHGIGRPCLWYDVLADCTTVNDSEPHSNYTTAAAVLNYLPSNQSRLDYSGYILVHELSHAYCAWWNYTIDGTTRTTPRYDWCHYSASLRTDQHSALGGYGWRDNHDGNWTATADLNPLTPDGAFDDTEYNLDEYLFGLIPESEVRPAHLLLPDLASSSRTTYAANDSLITVGDITAAMGPRWNEEDRQCVMLRCTNEYGDVFRGQGWGLFVGTVAPNDHVFWYSGAADGAVEWRYGTAHVGDGAWHQITASFSGTTGKLYVDGVLDIQWTIHTVSAANNVHTVIGCEDPTNPYFESWFSGSIDEIYVFNSVLTDAQVFQLYDSPPTTPGIPHLQTPGDESDGTFTLTWTASVDTDQTPLAYYYLAESVNTGGGWSAWHDISQTLTTNSITLTRAPGSYVYCVCAGDTASMWSGWATMPIPPMPGAQPIVVPVPDSVPPVTTATLSGTLGSNGWYKSAVAVTLTATDSNGIQATYYKIDGARKYTTYTGPFQVATDGKHTVTFYSVDTKGYTETPAKTASVWVDKTAPTTSASANVKKLTITLSASDGSGSGVAATYYKLDSGTWQTYTGPIKVTKGTHTIYYYSIDQAGNQEVTKSSTFTF